MKSGKLQIDGYYEDIDGIERDVDIEFDYDAAQKGTNIDPPVDEHYEIVEVYDKTGKKIDMKFLSEKQIETLQYCVEKHIEYMHEAVI